MKFYHWYRVFLWKEFQESIESDVTKVTCLMQYPKWEQASSQSFCHFWCQKAKETPSATSQVRLGIASYTE